MERRGRGGTVDHVVCDDAATIVYLANLATVTFHAWTSTVDHLARPDLVVIDLDPDPGQGLDVVRAAARAVRAACEELGLTPFVQTSGSKGYHVVVPLEPGPDVEVVHDFAADLAALVAARDPDRLTVEWRKANRQGRLLLDTARNGYAQTLVAPYSVRPRPEARWPPRSTGPSSAGSSPAATPWPTSAAAWPASPTRGPPWPPTPPPSTRSGPVWTSCWPRRAGDPSQAAGAGGGRAGRGGGADRRRSRLRAGPAG